MLLKSADTLGNGQKRRWKLIRPFIPHKIKWFFEGQPELRGQLWYKERKLIYDTVRRYRPYHCFEIGTWKGGGSTLYISQALHENGQGKLYTMEIDKVFYNEAKNNYQTHLEHLMPYTEFFLGDYKKIFFEILQLTGRVNFLFLDGPEDAKGTLDQYEFFLPYMKKDCVLMVHDWFTEKTRLVKPLVQNSGDWEIKKVLKPPHSPGFILAIRI